MRKIDKNARKNVNNCQNIAQNGVKCVKMVQNGQINAFKMTGIEPIVLRSGNKF